MSDVTLHGEYLPVYDGTADASQGSHSEGKTHQAGEKASWGLKLALLITLAHQTSTAVSKEKNFYKHDSLKILLFVQIYSVVSESTLVWEVVLSKSLT